MAKRILIADDSVTIQKAFAMTFAGADDVTVTSARSADEGLAIAQKVQPDLVIADGVMPGRSGYDLCAALRADPGLRTVPVFILASTQQPYDEARGQKAGANGHFIKPWDTTAILDKLREALRTGGGPAATPVGSPPAQRPTSPMPAPAIDDDEYGEISVDTRETDPFRGRVATPPPPDPRSRVATPPPPAPGRSTSSAMPALGVGPAPASVPPAPGSASPTMRPSLIPGMRPGAMPPARPGTVPVRPTAAGIPAIGPAGAPPRPAAPPVGRTMIGLPAANVPIPGVMRPSAPGPAPMPGIAPPPASMPSVAPVPPGPPARSSVTPMPPMVPVRSSATPMPPMAPVRPPSAPVAPLAARAPAPFVQSSPALGSASAIIDQKMAAFAAKGPEYEALAKLSREVIEQIVWEIVPELAEAIIRAEVEKRGRA